LQPFNEKEFRLFESNSAQYDEFSAIQQKQDSILGDFGFHPEANARFSSFVQAYWQSKQFVVMGGVRHDNFTGTHGTDKEENYSSLNPRLAILYKLGVKTSLRASYGKAFKEPAANLKYNSFAFLDGANLDSVYYAVAPNPKLEPEIFDSYEIGLRRQFFTQTFFDLTFFYNKISNQIVPVYVKPDSINYPLYTNPVHEPIRSFENSSQTKTILYGTEISLRIMNIIERYKLNAEIGVTLSKTEKYFSTELFSQKMAMIPEHIGKARLTFEPLKRTFISLQSQWSSKRDVVLQMDQNVAQHGIENFKTNGFVVFDVLVSYRFSKNLYGFCKVTNLTNKNYGGIEATGYDIDLRYNPQLGRNIRFGLSLVMN
jgi:hemoglobin/transferrin/lactoferrin receptor protein